VLIIIRVLSPFGKRKPSPRRIQKRGGADRRGTSVLPRTVFELPEGNLDNKRGGSRIEIGILDRGDTNGEEGGGAV